MLGTLHLPDFFKIMENIENCESKEDTMKVLKNLFKFFDENGDGKLSKAEAKIGFERMDLWKGHMDGGSSVHLDIHLTYSSYPWLT